MMTFTGRKIVRGFAKGPLVVIPASFSFLGDIDMTTSQVIAKDFLSQQLFLKHSILLFTETKGSSGGCVVLLTLARKGIAPLGILTLKPPDYNLTEGAIIAGIPFISEIEEKVFCYVKSGDVVSMDADKGILTSERLE